MNKENSTVFRLNTTLNIGHLIFSSISLLGVIITMWVNVNIRLTGLEYEVSSEKEKHHEVKETQEKLFIQFTKSNGEMTKLLYEIKLQLKDKEDRTKNR